MFKCYNCRNTFDEPVEDINPYPDFGGEPIECCPICGAVEMFDEILEEEEEEDDE